jgi:DNA-directed RNA polymerase I, II, and III subunit RPABC2
MENNWDPNDETNQVENAIVNDLLNADNQAADEPDFAEDGNKFMVMDYSEALEKANNAQKTTLPIMSKYEKAKVIGWRATQIAKGAKPLVDVKGIKDPFAKAEKELAEKKIPLIIRRILPDNSYEDWKIDEFMF